MTPAEQLDFRITAPANVKQNEILTPDALNFITELARKFEDRRQDLLRRRAIRQREIDSGKLPGFLPETGDVRQSNWRVAPIANGLLRSARRDHRPVDRKMIINAQNSGANVFMADLLDAGMDGINVTAADLLEVPVGDITEEGLRLNVNVGIQYLESWLGGDGCVPIYNLMEDAATAEISRAQVWQWVGHGAKLADGRTVDPDLV